MIRFTLTTLFILVSYLSYSTTWDEPWQKEIIQKSEYFVKAKVISKSKDSCTFEILKNFGDSLPNKIIIDGFFLLEMCSYSEGHGPELIFAKGEEGYLFLKKGENGNYKIPTPTSGFDRIVNKRVHGTFRHTYHQASLSQDVYELAYQEIWNKFHQSYYNKDVISEFIHSKLTLPPAGFDDDEIDLFFEQHVALESAYLLEIPLEFEVLNKFASCDNFHSRVSAIRALVHVPEDKTKSFLLNYLIDDEKDNFSKVIAIWTLWKMNDSKVKKKLFKLNKHLSSEETGFGGNIMDPRVCTRFPSPFSAVYGLKKVTNNEKMLQFLELK